MMIDSTIETDVKGGFIYYKTIKAIIFIKLTFICKQNQNQNLNQSFIPYALQALPAKILNNVFSRFGDLIDVYLLPNKNCGYAKYASETSAMKAIEVLHSAEICGVKLKVMEAEEPRDAKRKRYDD